MKQSDEDLLDRFAGQAMAGMLANYRIGAKMAEMGSQEYMQLLSQYAWTLADTMLAERKRRRQQP